MKIIFEYEILFYMISKIISYNLIFLNSDVSFHKMKYNFATLSSILKNILLINFDNFKNESIQ